MKISNDEIEDIIKIIKSLEDSGLLLERVETVQNEVKEQKHTETVQNEVKEQKEGFFSMLLATLGANLLGNPLTGKGAITTSQGREIYRAGKGEGINRAGEWIIRAGYGNNKMDF